MLDKRFLAIAVPVAVLIAVLVMVLKDKDLTLMGNYKSYVTDTFSEDDGMTCRIRIASTQSLGPTKAEVDAAVGMTFHFGGGIEFSDVSLDYHVSLKGDWSVVDDCVTVRPDTASFHYACVGSSAKSNTERVMAKQLMKFVDGALVPKIRRRIIEDNARPFKVYRHSSGGLVGHASGKTVILLKH